MRDGLGRETGLLPGERDLAAQLGVSRPVVREAVKRLESQGLLEVRHGVGIRRADRLHLPLNRALGLRVADPDERLRQALEVRRTLEPEVARLAAERLKRRDLQELTRLHGELESAEDLEKAAEADLAFHRAIARSSGNELFGLVLDAIADLGRESRLATMGVVGPGKAVRHHAAILKALSARDGAAAFRAMKKHIDEAVADLTAHSHDHEKDASIPA